MSTNYTGNPSATQAPSPAPDAGSPPIGTLPSDGDAANAASVAQAFKVPLDMLSYLQNPFASPTFGQPIGSWSDQGLRKRTEVDFAGLIRDNAFKWTEDFTPGSAFNVTGAGSSNVGRWTIATLGAGAASYSEPPAYAYANPPQPAILVGATVPRTSRELSLILDGGTTANHSELRLNDDYVTSTYADDALFSCEWHAEAFNVSAVNWVVGFTSAGEAVNNVQHGLFFIRPDTVGTNWKCRSINGGSPTEVDSGVLGTAGVRHTFRVDFVGANYLSGTGHALFWIDGNLVANITGTLPVNTGKWVIPIIGGTVSTGGIVGNQIMLVNRINYLQIERAAL